MASPDLESTSRRTILSIDGGGVRGALSIAFLERIEFLIQQHLQTQDGSEERLGNVFDLIGGSSAGAIIASALALNHTTAELRDLYLELAPKVFKRSFTRIVGVHPLFDARRLRREFRGIVGDRTLDSPDIRTGLAILLKRLDTGSAWILTNNPNAKYWDDPSDGSYIGNHRYELGELIRASTAAPYYFAPERVAIAQGEPEGLFIDGSISPYHNPALALFKAATIPAYGFGWPTGADLLTIVSIGAGTYRPQINPRKLRFKGTLYLAVQALLGMVADGAQLTMTMMQAMGTTPTPWPVNSELDDLSGVSFVPEPLFTFLRYDVLLERDWLRQELGMNKISDHDIEDLRELGNTKKIDLAYEIGQIAAEKTVKPEHIPLMLKELDSDLES